MPAVEGQPEAAWTCSFPGVGTGGTPRSTTSLASHSYHSDTIRSCRASEGEVERTTRDLSARPEHSYSGVPHRGHSAVWNASSLLGRPLLVLAFRTAAMARCGTPVREASRNAGPALRRRRMPEELSRATQCVRYRRIPGTLSSATRAFLHRRCPSIWIPAGPLRRACAAGKTGYREAASIRSGVCRARVSKSASWCRTERSARMAVAAIRQSTSLRTVSPLRLQVRYMPAACS
jgi:hypothetical protein